MKGELQDRVYYDLFLISQNSLKSKLDWILICAREILGGGWVLISVNAKVISYFRISGGNAYFRIKKYIHKFFLHVLYFYSNIFFISKILKNNHHNLLQVNHFILLNDQLAILNHFNLIFYLTGVILYYFLILIKLLLNFLILFFYQIIIFN